MTTRRTRLATRLGLGALSLIALGGVSAAALHWVGRPAAASVAPPAHTAPPAGGARLATAPTLTPALSGHPAPVTQVAATRPADSPFVVKRILSVPGPMDHGDWYWDDKDVPAGPLVITVDLKAQTMSVFRDGYEIGTAVILYGTDETPTPLGTFPITQKDKHHISNLYDAPMPYMLRLTNDGVSIHGSTVKLNYASHGCIGVPNAFAARLFDQAKLGDKVIITNGRMLGQGGTILPGA